jgi:adenosine deaminase CECR1
MSHEFYQIMVGAPTMSLYSWKQLAKWSIQYSCLEVEEKKEGQDILDKSWKEFCQTVVREYGPLMKEEFPDEIDPYRAEAAYQPRTRKHATIEKAEREQPDVVKAEREKARLWAESFTTTNNNNNNHTKQ